PSEQQIKMVALPRNHLYRTPIRLRNGRPTRGGFSILRAKIHHRGDLADELDLEAAVDRMQHDPLDEAAQDLERLGTRVGSGERLLQVRDLLAVKLGEVRMEARQRRGCVRDHSLELGLAALQLFELALQSRRAKPVGNRIDEPVQLAGDLIQLAP